MTCICPPNAFNITCEEHGLRRAAPFVPLVHTVYDPHQKRLTSFIQEPHETERQFKERVLAPLYREAERQAFVRKHAQADCPKCRGRGEREIDPPFVSTCRWMQVCSCVVLPDGSKP